MELTYCDRCVMDGSAKELVIDEIGFCNFCVRASVSLMEIDLDKPKLPQLIEQIKKDGQGKEYDCLMGLSGGLDSSTALHHAVKLGLRPLCFSIDNGWNDPKADENIMRLVETLRVPFYRYTIDLAKFRELQGAFISAGLINLEIPTDHIILAASYELASKYGIKHIVSGGNVVGESIMPASWSYSARDLRHIKNVFWNFTGKKLTGLPTCGLLKLNWYWWVKGIKTSYLLDYLDYNIKDSKVLLAKEYGWQDYYEKHCESIFTWWFQNFYLYEKFGIDKRKAHLSSLINAGQMTRQEALEIIGLRPEYPKIGLEGVLHRYQKRSHYDFKTDEKRFLAISKSVRWLKKCFS